MRKLLFATTALILAMPVAANALSVGVSAGVSGSAGVGEGFRSGDGRCAR